MGSRRSETITVVKRELQAVGLEAVVEGRKHAKIRFYWRRQRYTYVVPRTTSDGGRAVKNCRAGIRRLLRQIGAL